MQPLVCGWITQHKENSWMSIVGRLSHMCEHIKAKKQRVPKNWLNQSTRFRMCAKAKRHPPWEVWAPEHRAGTWAAWRQRAAGRSGWWTPLPPNPTGRACTDRYTLHAALPAWKKRETQVKHTDSNLFNHLKTHPDDLLIHFQSIPRGPFIRILLFSAKTKTPVVI